MDDARLNRHRVVSQAEWIEARKKLLKKEKEQTYLRDKINAERQALPWVKVEKEYVFDTPTGRKTLADLFDGRSQLIIKHFMLGPGWQEGCVGCSFEVDHVEGALMHIKHHDVNYVSVARAPIQEIEAFKRRMGWQFEWVSSQNSDFNFDFFVSFTPEQVKKGEVYYNYETKPIPMEELSGLSVFYKDETGQIFHTYSVYARGAEETLSSYMLLDLTPKGRNEHGPEHNLTDWVRHHDRYGAGGHVDNTGRYQVGEQRGTGAAEKSGECCH